MPFARHVTARVGYASARAVESDYPPLSEGGGFTHDGIFGDRRPVARKERPGVTGLRDGIERLDPLPRKSVVHHFSLSAQ